MDRYFPRVAARVRGEVRGRHREFDKRSAGRRGAARGGGTRAQPTSTDHARLRELAEIIRAGENAEVNRIAQSGELEVLMATYPDRSHARRNMLRRRAWWWIAFEPAPPRGMNFSRARPRAAAIAARLSAIVCRESTMRKAMGFDVIYFPPIHPIGHTNRKGRNNSVTCEPGEPGVPYAIGS